ncbi:MULTISPECIES: hypothetical protein [Marinobacter]|uniref:hypothetical protein n=1 Tax=Marinobacter TaxID=2742 RepID=UPI003B438E1C|nr:hypothetical protein PBN92_05845 [Marinobacter alkaliphilus]
MEMNTIIGFFAVTFGIYTLIARQIAPHQFAKLGPMKEKFGDRGGLAVHFLGYTLMPLIIGGVLLYKAFVLGHF